MQPFLYEVKGFYHYTRGEDQAALSNYQRAIELGGASPQLHYKIGSVYLMQRRWTEAYRHFSQALASDSNNPDFWSALGLWAYMQSKIPQAIYYWEASLKRDSTYDKARTFLYDVHLNLLNQPEIAKKRYLDPYWVTRRFDPLLNFQLGNYYLKKLEDAIKRNEPKKVQTSIALNAIQAYTQAILAHASYAQAHYNRGYVYYILKEYDRALDDFARAAELNPHDAKAYFMKGSLFEFRKDTLKAIEAYERALLLDSTMKEAMDALRELKAVFSSYRRTTK
ncbi:MAG: tetratricopeptide repeat protein [Bacteroidia bacterium]|nr:tetratricopeptide repeat protein [Bacteroidia bacterium]